MIDFNLYFNFFLMFKDLSLFEFLKLISRLLNINQVLANHLNILLYIIAIG